MVPSAACDLVMSVEHPAYEKGGPCVGCAFRRGTDANQTAHTQELARLSVEGFRVFQCHEHPHVCRGFMAAVNIRGVPQDEDDQRWCEVAGLGADLLQQVIESARAAERDARLGVS